MGKIMTPSTKQKMLELAEAYCHPNDKTHSAKAKYFIDGFTAASELYEAELGPDNETTWKQMYEQAERRREQTKAREAELRLELGARHTKIETLESNCESLRTKKNTLIQALIIIKDLGSHCSSSMDAASTAMQVARAALEKVGVKNG